MVGGGGRVIRPSPLPRVFCPAELSALLIPPKDATMSPSIYANTLTGDPLRHFQAKTGVRPGQPKQRSNVIVLTPLGTTSTTTTYT